MKLDLPVLMFLTYFRRLLIVTLAAIWAVVVVNSMVATVLIFLPIAVLFWICLGALAVTAETRHDPKPQSEHNEFQIGKLRRSANGLSRY